MQLSQAYQGRSVSHSYLDEYASILLSPGCMCNSLDLYSISPFIQSLVPSPQGARVVRPHPLAWAWY
jgi:hypothetical protein